MKKKCEKCKRDLPLDTSSSVYACTAGTGCADYSIPNVTDHQHLGQVMQEIKKDEKLISVKDGCVVMEWNHAGYIVELRRIKGWAELTDWMIHLCGKGWMTPNRLAIFAETAIKAKGWKRKNA